MDEPTTGQDISHPLFVRLYRRGRVAADGRGEVEHRRRLVAGLHGLIVEVGAGDGGNFPHYPPAVREVVAVEPEPRFRELARRAAQAAPVPVTVARGTAAALPVADAGADAVVASLVLCTVPDQRAALAEARRVLRPGGELRFYEHVHADRQPLRAVLEVADRTRLWPLIAGGCHPNRRTVEAIEAAGFRVERVERFDFAPSPVLPAVPHVLGSARVTSSA